MVEQANILEGIKKSREQEKRKFKQSLELIINLKELDIKKEEGKIDEFIELPAGRGRDAKVCAFVGPELKPSAEKICDSFVLSDDFEKLDKRKIRNIARDNDFFIAQANVMPAVAKTFGRFLSALGKMPSPKAGHVVPPKANIEPLVKSLRKTVHVSIKKAPVFQTLIGNETMDDDDLAKNATTVMERLKGKLPKGEHNIKSVLLKTTMGKPVKL